MKKKIIIPVLSLACLLMLAGCTKVSLTGNSTSNVSSPNGAMDGDTPPEGETPPDGVTPPEGAPKGGGQQGGPMSN